MSIKKNSWTVIEISSSSSDDEEERSSNRKSPLSCLQVRTKAEKSRDDDDCCILDFDPYDTVAVVLQTKLSISSDCRPSEEHDLSVVAERGQLACRDYPHSRQYCVEYPFNKTPHESYCPQCYCYVCDAVAPCKNWKGTILAHCHASDVSDTWKNLRNARRRTKVDAK